MREIQEMEDVLEIEEALRASRLSAKCALVVRVGNILCDCKGKNYKAEMLLRGFLADDLDNKKNCMVLSVTGSFAEKEAAREIVEDCYVFLALNIGRIQLETVCILEQISKNPPYPEFTRAIQDKLRANRIAV